jgi:hypothetical protein
MPTNANIPPANGYADGPITKAPDWHSLVVLDILCNNLATGLFLVAALAEFAAPTVFAPVVRWAYPVSFALLLIDFACLVLDLGDPLRFHHMLRVFKPGSPMSLGTWCLTAFSLALAVLVAVEAFVTIGWMPGDSAIAWWLRKMAILAALPFAFGSAAYKGVLFSTSAQPGWKDARWLGAYFINSAVMLGAGILLVISAMLGATRAVAILSPALGFLVALNLIPFGLLVRSACPLLFRTCTRRQLTTVGICLCLTGVGIPTAALLSGGGLVTVCVAVFSLVAASFGIRSAIVRVPHTAACGARRH